MPTRVKRLASNATILFVCGLAAFAAGAIVVHAASESQAARAIKKQRAIPSFKIMTRLSERLSPGKTTQVRLYLANNLNKPVTVKRLSLKLRVDEAHAAKGCSVKRDYRVIQLPKRAFPYTLKPRGRPSGTKKSRKNQRARWRRMRPKQAAHLPAIKMLDLRDVNQDACKGARLRVSFRTTPTRKKKSRMRSRSAR